MLSGSKSVLLGKVVATHGLRGQLRVVPFSGETTTLASLRTVFLGKPDGSMEPFEVEHAAVHGNRVNITFKGLGTIEQVLSLVGRSLYVRREDLPDLDSGEYYWVDLLGLQVITVGGESLGKLTDIIATGSNDVYVITEGNREYLLPAMEDVIVDIDLDDGIMTVSPPEGLLDL